MKDYEIITTDSAYDLEYEINQKLQAGYLLIGGVFVRQYEHADDTYGQAIYKPIK